MLIETILAAFEMDEILYELREHSAGLNCGRWDYIFSFIKKFRNHPDFVLPDRAQVTMDRHFLKSYVELLIQTCHRRGIHAMGGMAAQIPIKNDPAANEQALEKVRQDKLREVKAGHDGTWVAHPGLVPIAKEIFDEYMQDAEPDCTQARRRARHRRRICSRFPRARSPKQGLRWNIDVGMQYLESWLRGIGCVPIYNLMEDAATAEICRAQVWQWVKHGAQLNDGRPVTAAMVKQIIAQRAAELRLRPQAERREIATGRRNILEELTTGTRVPGVPHACQLRLIGLERQAWAHERLLPSCRLTKPCSRSLRSILLQREIERGIDCLRSHQD